MRAIQQQFLAVVETQMDKLIFTALVLLVLLSILQLVKMSQTTRQLTYLTDKLTGYLKAVLEDEPEEETEEKGDYDENQEFVSYQERNMRESIEQQKRQKNMRETQVIDAVLSEIFP